MFIPKSARAKARSEVLAHIIVGQCHVIGVDVKVGPMSAGASAPAKLPAMSTGASAPAKSARRTLTPHIFGEERQVLPEKYSRKKRAVRRISETLRCAQGDSFINNFHSSTIIPALYGFRLY